MEESISPNLESNIKSIPEVLKSLGKGEIAGNENARKSLGNTYATFNAALGKSGLASVFARNELTVFAPNDAAFAELGLNPGNIGELEGLTEILLYHVVSGSVLAADLTEGLVPTLNGAAVEISLTNGPMVNESSIILTDKMARNGVIHGIDAVLMPPVSNVMDLLDDATTGADFTTLRTAIYIVPGLKEEFATRENITVFAPTNAAFAKIGLNSLNISGIDPAILREILRYHVFGGGRLFSEDLVDGPIIMSEGGTLIVNTSSSNTFVIDENGGSSNLIETNIQASNGVIHKIDAVLIPQ
ncbi:Uncaracterized surface protein containing fasciclin (FAS1) repeats [Algoriphagus halophilus]|uniref:Uncaracterized surface protein containing fasciclin (FAS1) repeats n=2 Tax=Algoriphagus halophilus TaxID=226505 RepID=A0A1N6DYH7_9BACT|nr:Uncaracterized surface protein containing fasciclin (FAS1) repeats [Algoriphagus halophilus]